MCVCVCVCTYVWGITTDEIEIVIPNVNSLVALHECLLFELQCLIGLVCLVCLVWFFGISTFVGYLTPNPFLCK